MTRERARGVAATFAVAILAFAVALHPVVSEDLFWHLASGRWILEHRELPRTDFLTYTLTDRPWTNLQWAGDAAVAALWTAAGADGVVLVKAIAWGALGALLVAAGRAAGAGPGAAGAAATLAILASAERTFERPEIATYLLLAAASFVTLRRSASARALGLVVLLGAAWANLHALAFLGPALFGWRSALAAGVERSRRGAVSFAAAAACAGVAMLANPYGFATWTFPRTLLQRISGEEAIFGRIREFESPLAAGNDPALRAFWIFAASIVLACAAAFALRRAGRARSNDFVDSPPSLATLALLAAPFLVLALLARRNIPLFAIVAMPALARAFAACAVHAPPRAARFAGALVPAASLALAAAVFAGASPALLGLWRDRGLGVAPGLFPDAALATLTAAERKGPLFNDLEYGGFVSWRNPERKTFIDGRLEVAGPERLATYVDAHRDPSVWERLDRSWGFDALLLAHAERGTAAFLRARLDDGLWSLVRLDPEAALLVRAGSADVSPPSASPPSRAVWDSLFAVDRGPEPHAGRAFALCAAPIDRLARRAQQGPRHATVRSANRLANACITVGWVDAASEGYDRVLATAPRDPEALFNRAFCEALRGDAAEAVRRWTSALPLVDRASRGRFQEAIDRFGAAENGAPPAPR